MTRFVKLRDAAGKEVRLELDPSIRAHTDNEPLNPWEPEVPLRIVLPEHLQRERLQVEKEKRAARLEKKNKRKSRRKAQRRGRT